MQLTLLEYVQNILSAMSSDEVNSISDTTESLQVAEIVRTTFFNIVTRADLPDQESLFQLDPSLDPNSPVLMYSPENVKKIEWVKYFDTSNSADMYKYVTILPIQQFVDYVNHYNVTDANVETMLFKVNGETFSFNYKNDTQPRYCTCISNYYMIFDSFDATQESTLQASKTQCWGLLSPQFLMEDNFVPDLEDEQVPLLLNEAKSLAFVELKQVTHQKAEQEAKRQWSSLQKDKSLDNKPSYFDQLPNYGRLSSFRREPHIRWS